MGELIKRSVNAQKNVAEFLAKQANLSAPSPEQLARFELERRRVLKAGRNRRPGSSPPRREEGAKFTEVMEALQRAAGSDQPNVDVGKELGLSRWTVAKYAQRGRELGMLPKVVRRPG